MNPAARRAEYLRESGRTEVFIAPKTKPVRVPMRAEVKRRLDRIRPPKRQAGSRNPTTCDELITAMLEHATHLPFRLDGMLLTDTWTLRWSCDCSNGPGRGVIVKTSLWADYRDVFFEAVRRLNLEREKPYRPAG